MKTTLNMETPAAASHLRGCAPGREAEGESLSRSPTSNLMTARPLARSASNRCHETLSHCRHRRQITERPHPSNYFESKVSVMRTLVKEEVQEPLGRLQREAAHFGPESGVHLVFNLKDPSQLPSVTAEKAFRARTCAVMS